MSDGPLWLKDRRVAKVVAEAIAYGDTGKEAYELLAWVVMPNHVHMVISEIMQWLKTATAARANRILTRAGDFWQREYFDHWVRSGDELTAIIAYTEHNPIEARLVSSPEHWPWSSARMPAARPPAPLDC